MVMCVLNKEKDMYMITGVNANSRMLQMTKKYWYWSNMLAILEIDSGLPLLSQAPEQSMTVLKVQ